MDHDRDGKLTRDEFITGILNTSKFTLCLGTQQCFLNFISGLSFTTLLHIFGYMLTSTASEHIKPVQRPAFTNVHQRLQLFEPCRTDGVLTVNAVLVE